ncbi:MAG TPA: ATP-binding protein [Enhygromyxa sp.]|nr:ATP-binding protein [Enhygromyxa sp.]
MHDESKVIRGIEILWDTARGTMQSVGRSLVALWLDPSLLHMLAPLRDEMGTELFQLVVAHSSSLGTKADYETMVTVFADTFEEGFLAWGRAVGVVGWGRFELVAMDRAAGTAKVIVRSPWELVMQQRLEEPWGCPFMRGKLIGIFRFALGVNCWADERCYVEDGEPVLELSLYRSSLTIESELARLRVEMATRESQRLQDEVALRTEMHRASEERLRATLASMDSWVFTLDAAGGIVSHHVPGGTEHASFPEHAVGRTLAELLPVDAAAALESAAKEVLADGRTHAIDYEVPRDDGVLCFGASLSPLRDAESNVRAVTVVVHETTARRRAQERHAQLEAQLRQAQKMEAIGQLTGGVAHDFNNLLTVIYGNLELARYKSLDAESTVFINEALDAAKTAATLTHRLLAFSRRQPLQPHRVDPKVLVEGMEVLLRRTLGEHIDIEIAESTGQWQCEIDGAQLESAILNLVLNARDAMPDGGKITIETTNVRISPEYADAYHPLRPGQYVLVAVSDTGEGMSEEVQRRAFEPFFTTKGMGRGSGLGLSMVYGFVRQSSGHIMIYSEPGVGTTVKLYLPRSTEETAERRQVSWSGAPPPGNGALILVVEDDSPLRKVSVRFLLDLGYRTLDCGTAAEAMQILQTGTHVDLLFTDVVLRGEMSGAQLVEVAKQLRPGLPCLYTSGYTEGAIHGRLDPDVQLLEKPFTKDSLAWRVHMALQMSAADVPHALMPR